MESPKTKLLYDYLIVDDKVTREQERLIGFPMSPKQVERLVHESIEEIEELESKVKKLEKKVRSLENLCTIMGDGGRNDYCPYSPQPVKDCSNCKIEGSIDCPKGGIHASK